MSIFSFFRIIFIVLATIGTSFLLPIITALCCHEEQVIQAFLIPMVASWIFGVFFFLKGRKVQIKFSTRAVFIFVSSVWIFISLFGALPLWLSGAIPNFTDAFFESTSGFSTTGATILSEIESLPRSINLWRCEMHWLGGMGIIALTVALLPLLGVGSFQLIKAESTGPEKGKITPKMANTAEVLWFLYFGFTVAETIILQLCGMDFIDALAHAFSTLGTGGFSTRNSSIASYNSVSIEIVCTIFMFLSGINFSLYFYLILRKFGEIKKNSEFKAYLLIFGVVTVMLTLTLISHYGSLSKAFRYSTFQVASIMTTTGFATTDYLTWPSISQFFIFILFFIGGCSGSTSGGFKVIRWVILWKQSRNEMLRMLHPYGVFTLRVNGQPGRKDLVLNVGSFIFVYFVVVFVTTLIGTAANLDIFTSLTTSLTMIGSIGPAFGSLGPSENYGALLPWLKWWYCFVMIAGRLELYNMIIILIKDFWQR